MRHQTHQNLLKDLFPGDNQPDLLNWDELTIKRIFTDQSQEFDQIYSKLWEEFGEKGEVEQKEILSKRLKWEPENFFASPENPLTSFSDSYPRRYSLSYELLGVWKGSEFVAVRDHSIILLPDIPLCVVHLSHSLINPPYRGKGLAKWIRAWPIQGARACLAKAKLPDSTPIVLVAEMQALSSAAANQIRMRSYQRGGFRMIDPASVEYLQPDFRSPQVIDASGGPKPIPLRLLIRWIEPSGKAAEEPVIRTQLSGEEVQRIVAALYFMYGATFRPQDMSALWKNLQKTYPSESSQVQLLLPCPKK